MWTWKLKLSCTIFACYRDLQVRLQNASAAYVTGTGTFSGIGSVRAEASASDAVCGDSDAGKGNLLATASVQITTFLSTGRRHDVNPHVSTDQFRYYCASRFPVRCQ